MKVYSGRRDGKGNCIVRVIGADGDSRLLQPRLDLENHSPTGFEWGYGGSGPAQLALAILADVLDGNDYLAGRLHQRFKWKFIAPLNRDEPWHITEQAVIEFVSDMIIKGENHESAT